MPKNNTNLNTQKNYVPTESESSLKGTLIFVMFVGLFIVGSWSAIFFLFLNRL
ncbi:cytochrome c oxidase subunit 2A [Anaerobacillus sp. CMMVII]|uniref:cytochrome c oxidase subunit 2A n=1 Tax=Anaerobacillus sp. CMMVII TaxID=2755588 RepID=UPI0021B72379|nr:cytochrome c oxidase subunit 2A [Anaerobacillus sp. CMMVII]MCT8136555.1 cytochrome c oxidase subunit 2A [Anaerobacillus sp. CMMVII]